MIMKRAGWHICSIIGGKYLCCTGYTHLHQQRGGLKVRLQIKLTCNTKLGFFLGILKEEGFGNKLHCQFCMRAFLQNDSADYSRL